VDVTTLPTHPFTGQTAIGIVGGKPVWPVAGGSQPVGGGDETDEPDDDQDTDETEEASEETEEPEVDWKAKYEEQAAALEASQAKLQRARAQAKSLREQQAAASTTPPAPARRQQPKLDPEPVVVQDTAEVERWQVRAVLADAKSALIQRGCDPDLVDAPLSKLKVGEIDWDDDEPILDEYLDAMEERYPKLFAKPEPVAAAAPRVGGVRRAASIDQAAGTGSTGRAPQERKSFGQALWESGQGDIRAPRRRP
jgi:hypothetical protein